MCFGAVVLKGGLGVGWRNGAHGRIVATRRLLRQHPRPRGARRASRAQKPPAASLPLGLSPAAPHCGQARARAQFCENAQHDLAAIPTLRVVDARGSPVAAQPHVPGEHAAVPAKASRRGEGKKAAGSCEKATRRAAFAQTGRRNAKPAQQNSAEVPKNSPQDQSSADTSPEARRQRTATFLQNSKQKLR